MLYSHMPDWIYASKDLSASAKLLMQRIFTLSKDGTQHVYINRTVFAESLGMSGRTLTNVFKELEAMNLIQEVQNSNRWDRTRNFKVTDKACKDLENGTSIDVEKIATSTAQNLPHRDGKNCNIEIEKNSTPMEKIATSTAQNLLSLHQIEIKKDKEGNIYICDDNKKDSTKAKKEMKKVSYPATVEEVEILFNEHIQKWTSEKPEIKNINVKYESSLFLDYWQSANWKRKGKAVKSVKGAVATWIANAARNFGYRPRQTHKTAQEIEQFAQGVQELVDQQYNAFNSNNNISDAEVVDIKDVSEIENLFLETKTR